MTGLSTITTMIAKAGLTFFDRILAKGGVEGRRAHHFDLISRVRLALFISCDCHKVRIIIRMTSTATFDKSSLVYAFFIVETFVEVREVEVFFRRHGVQHGLPLLASLSLN